MLVCNKGLEQMSNWPWSVMKYASEILVDFKHHLTLNDPYSFETLSEPPASKGQPNCSCWLTVSECWWSTFLSLRGGRFPRNETADLGYKYLDWQMSMLSHIYIYILIPVVVCHDRDYIHYILQIWISSHHGMLFHSNHSSISSVTALHHGSGVNL